MQDAAATGGGFAQSREFAAAKSALTLRERRLAGRTLRRRDVASDPRVARMVAARARWMLHERRDDRGRRVTLGVFAGLCFALGAIQLAAGDDLGAGCFFAAALVFGVMLWRARPGVRESLAATERANREVAERAGLAPAPDGDLPVRETAGAIARKAALLWVFYDVLVGVLSLLFDGRSLTVLTVIGNGAVEATVLTAFNVWTMWRQNRTLAPMREPA